jgi:hypothetical protein
MDDFTAMAACLNNTATVRRCMCNCHNGTVKSGLVGYSLILLFSGNVEMSDLPPCFHGSIS